MELRETKSFSLMPEIYARLRKDATLRNESISRRLENVLMEYYKMKINTPEDDSGVGGEKAG